MRTLLILAALLPALAFGNGKPAPPQADPAPVAVNIHAEAEVSAAAEAQAEAKAAAAGYGGSASLAYNARRNAPGIAMSHPQATMDCIRGFGIGASNANGALLLGPQWKDKDCMALLQFQQLAELGLPVPAAKAYCARKRFYAPFGYEAACVAGMVAALTAPPPEPVVVERVVPDAACSEKLRRCENITGRK